MSTDELETDLTRQTENSPRELLTRTFFFLCAALSIVTTISIVVLLVTEAAKFFTITAPLMGVTGETASLVDFLTGTTWQINSGEFGVLALVSATLMITIGSAVIAIPLGVATAIYLSEYASQRARSVLKPALEILAGVPTVVYGFFALIYITPALATVIPQIGTFNMLSASIVVGIMIIPMVASISEDAMSAVPDDLRQAGYGMGATKFDVATGIVVPAALSGIFSSFILALSRAIGETMAVTIAAGSRAQFLNPVNPASFLEGSLPMTAAMVQLLLGDITGGGLAYRSLFAIGLVLFVITLVMNVISDFVAQRYREEY
ncbi:MULTISPECIES: phosphate ABC transporter permease subunit PstC [Halobellus]|jgi:phosphate transport system permease protein|uniref:phosphate ABC transporter permease subunit PstC n=1 Tax=Halobellus TaxID=1073986 RepID=UPI000EF1D316|nr:MULTISPECIES: phosphate ABC transporter permease subunit PstC [Halobellus]MDQ2054772.1 phosphate ABC transporter permease subunit PstC [Halobellus sp. H-GB7]RLM88891.1 phosphate ABC transporter permease subunit PstC [Halobellus sp. Atlit-38R]